MKKFVAVYKDRSLSPFLSAETIQYHYGKHHAGYANALNELIRGTEFEDLSLCEIVSRSRNTNQKIFNNASQLFNHNFYWECLAKSISLPRGKLSDLIIQQFGSLEEFQNQYISFASALFGSGWSWVVEQNENLKFINTQNAESPYGKSSNLICVVDLWEHAYYIDYRNNRIEYLEKIIKNCINWEFCASLIT